MNYWIFKVSSHKEYDLTGEEIFNQRMRDGFWGLSEGTKNRGRLEEKDEVVFYIAYPVKAFSGTVTLKSECKKLNDAQRKQYGHDKQFYTDNDYGVWLEDIDPWSKRKPIEPMIPKLKFIKNKRAWGTHLQGGVTQISQEDFEFIVR